MVSFQCDACQDIVKKPKLDQHHGRGCGASFTCIDCSQTFAAPVDWKAHTSCISEAQKYQKALYRPKTTNSSAGMVRAASSTGKFRGWQGARPPLGRPRFQPTGANGTPLGTPTRMSPVTISPQANDTKGAPTTPAETTEPPVGARKKSSKRRKLDEGNGATTEACKPVASVQQDEQNATGKDKKDKKGKKKGKERHKEAAEAKVVDAPADRTQAPQEDTLPSPNVAVTAPSRGAEKSKNKKKEELQTQVQPVSDETVDMIATEVNSTRNGDDDKEKKKKKKKRSNATAAAGDGDGFFSSAAAATQSGIDKPKTKRKRVAEAETAEEVDGGAEHKKRKKKKETSNA